MGYEVKYQYHAKDENGEYNTDETKEGSIKVGTPYEDLPLDNLAGKVMSLLARRNILVTEIETYEYTKKKISFSEEENGIKIKNKKFKFDDGPPVQCSEEYNVKEQLQAIISAHPELLEGAAQTPTAPAQGSIRPVPTKVDSTPHQSREQVIRREYYWPDDERWVNYARNTNPNMSFTLKKAYPIYAEKNEPSDGQTIGGILYKTRDDNGNLMWAVDKLFSMSIPQGDLTGKTDGGLSDAGLVWSGTQNDNMPAIR
jgi:hypothetical protein